MTETRTRYIIQHVDGAYVDVHFNKYRDFMKATRFNSEEEIYFFLTGYYKPDRPEDYHAVPIKITYELEETPCATKVNPSST